MNESRPTPTTELAGARVAFLATDGFELSELRSPKEALTHVGARVDIVALRSGSIKGWQDGDWHGTQQVDVLVEEARMEDYDALVIPGGVISPDKLRMDPHAVAFVRAFANAGKPICAICHGPWLLAEADVVRGRQLTSYGSIRTDLVNAGANWTDAEVVVDQGLVTSRSPKDLPAFNLRVLEVVAKALRVPEPRVGTV